MFGFLQRYKGLQEGARRFMVVDDEAIHEAEVALGLRFPDSLRAFYREIGYGWLADEARPAIRNLFIHPLDIVDLVRGESGFAPPEPFLDGDLPFFDAGGDRFLVMRPASSEPDVIFLGSSAGPRVAENLVEFCRSLEVDPAFFDAPLDLP